MSLARAIRYEIEACSAKEHLLARRRAYLTLAGVQLATGISDAVVTLLLRERGITLKFGAGEGRDAGSVPATSRAGARQKYLHPCAALPSEEN